MAIRGGMAVDLRRAFLAGEHDATDRYRMALYTKAAKISPRTPEYTTAGEVKGPGYDAGGRDIPGWTVDGDGVIRFEDVVWPNSTIKARGCLIYNDSKPGMPTVAILTFGRDVVSENGPFTVFLPPGEPLLSVEVVNV